jgi:hypothetical protein
MNKKIQIINYIEHLSLQYLAHQNNKVNKSDGIYCDTIEEAEQAINDMLPDDITEKLYDILQTQVEELSDDETMDIDEDFLDRCKECVNRKIEAL